jgi:hypothetical protein
MGVVRDSVIEGYNDYIAGLREAQDGGKTLVTTVVWDSQGIESRGEALPVAEAALLDHGSYYPRALTPLYDAMGRTIHKTREALDAHDGDAKVLFVVMTDGCENASREYTRDDVFRLVTELEDTDRWTFIYLGADHDAYGQSASVGISSGNTALYSSDPQSVQNTTDSLTRVTTNYASTAGSSPTAFSDAGQAQDYRTTANPYKGDPGKDTGHVG